MMMFRPQTVTQGKIFDGKCYSGKRMSKAYADIPNMNVSAIKAFSGFRFYIGDDLLFVLFKIYPSTYKGEQYKGSQDSQNL